MAKKSNRALLLAGTAISSLSGVHKKQQDEAEKLRKLKERHRKEQEARRRK